jgi:hypothetical protein
VCVCFDFVFVQVTQLQYSSMPEKNKRKRPLSVCCLRVGRLLLEQGGSTDSFSPGAWPLQFTFFYRLSAGSRFFLTILTNLDVLALFLAKNSFVCGFRFSGLSTI